MCAAQRARGGQPSPEQGLGAKLAARPCHQQARQMNRFFDFAPPRLLRCNTLHTSCAGGLLGCQAGWTQGWNGMAWTFKLLAA